MAFLLRFHYYQLLTPLYACNLKPRYPKTEVRLVNFLISINSPLLEWSTCQCWKTSSSSSVQVSYDWLWTTCFYIRTCQRECFKVVHSVSMQVLALNLIYCDLTLALPLACSVELLISCQTWTIVMPECSEMNWITGKIHPVTIILLGSVIGEAGP